MQISNSTKILRLKLVNHIGITKGMGLNEIEIDFTQTNHRLILLLGANGGGKSTIMSTLHPFAGVFDTNRSTIVPEGEDGLKEIDIEQYGVVYKIVHHYGAKKNSSFITKIEEDGTETKLNPAGTVRNYPSIVAEHLGVTENFFKLLKIGSQADNFIDLKSTQRKEFIGDFTPDVAPFLTAYANVSAKYSETTREIRYITDESSKLEDYTTVEKNIQILTNTITSLRTKQSKIAVTKSKLQELLDENSEILASIETLESEIANLNKKVILDNDSIDEINAIYRGNLIKPETTIKDLKEALAVRETNIEVYRDDLNAKRIALAELNQSLKSINDQINQIKKDIKSLTGDGGVLEVAKLEKLLVAIKGGKSAILNGSGYTEEDLEDCDIDAIRESIVAHRAMLAAAGTLESYVISNRPSYFFDFIEEEELPLQSIPETIKEWTELHNEGLTDLSCAKSEIKELEDRLSTLTAERKAGRAAQKLINQCSVGDESCCLFKTIDSANSDKASSDITITEDLIRDKQEYVDTLLTSTGQMKSVIEYLELVHKTAHNEDPAFKESMELLLITLTNSGHSYDSINQLLVSANRDIFNELETTANTIISSFTKIIKYLNEVRKIEETEAEIAKYSESAATLTLLNRNLTKTEAKCTPIQDKIDTITPDIEQAAKKVSLVEKAIVAIRNVLQYKLNIKGYNAEIKQRTEQLDKWKAQVQKVLQAKDDILIAVNEEKEVEESIDSYQQDLDTERLNSSRIKEFRKRKEILETTRAKLAYIKDSLDVKSGIPLVLVGEYLDGIRNSTNRLLNIAFHGKFYTDFNITDKEFAIPIFQNGSKSANDIKECSQGEISLVKTSLSLGIVAQAISALKKQYSIVSLDEIDAEFDHRNRLVFLDMLNRQLDILHSEQCFVITHNDSFFSSAAGLILLPGHSIDTSDAEFMENKNILFQL